MQYTSHVIWYTPSYLKNSLHEVSLIHHLLPISCKQGLLDKSIMVFPYTCSILHRVDSPLMM